MGPGRKLSMAEKFHIFISGGLFLSLLHHRSRYIVESRKQARPILSAFSSATLEKSLLFSARKEAALLPLSRHAYFSVSTRFPMVFVSSFLNLYLFSSFGHFPFHSRGTLIIDAELLKFIVSFCLAKLQRS
jgi:hypothetical protein